MLASEQDALYEVERNYTYSRRSLWYREITGKPIKNPDYKRFPYTILLEGQQEVENYSDEVVATRKDDLFIERTKIPPECYY